ncbi:hypothetical protein FACS189472_08990 [Alphaproteobacteria bacterium]|nr:hypothetical protein FACS189472_08990 [Alphaproteobacteria bacterium]
MKSREEVNLEFSLYFKREVNMAKKGYNHMTLEIRSQIQVLKSIGLSQRKIAEKIRISQSSVSREIARNSTGCEYAAKIADKKAIERQSSSVNVPKKPKGNLELKNRERIEKDWSPGASCKVAST